MSDAHGWVLGVVAVAEWYAACQHACWCCSLSLGQLNFLVFTQTSNMLAVLCL